MNIMIPFTAVAGILTYIWPFVRGKAAYIVVAIIYGFASGAYISLFIIPIIVMGEHGDLGRRLGMFITIGSIGALTGPPISGAINNRTGGYAAVGIYAGMLLFPFAFS